MLKDTLTQQQHKFLSKYAQTLDLELSATDAGYNSAGAKTQAKRLLLREKFLTALDEIIEEKARRYEISKGYVVKKIYEVINYATVKNESGKAQMDGALAIRAIDLLSKLLEIFKPHGENQNQASICEILGVDIDKI